MNPIKYFLIMVAVSVTTACYTPTPVYAELEVAITEGVFKPIPIAIPTFQGTTAQSAVIAQNISQVIASDLEGCGLFEIVNPQAYIQDSNAVVHGPRFADWRILNAQGLVGGVVTEQAGQIQVMYRLFDVLQEKLLEEDNKGSPSTNWRRIAHVIADGIYKRMTGEEGYFDSRVAFVTVSGSQTNPVKKLAIMDYDGANVKMLTNGANMAITPRFSPNSQQLAYVEFVKNKKAAKATVYLVDIGTGARRPVGQFPGLSFSPRFAPDGSHLLMDMASKGVTSIYTMNLATHKVDRLTKTPSSIDTSPCYSPDGTQIAFNSDRGGAPQIYIMNAQGGDAKRISFGQGRYYTPVWSPRGDFIAFTKNLNGTFYIGVMKMDGSGERMLAQSAGRGVVEAPTFSPNGRVLMYTKTNGIGGTRIYSIDLSGRNEREVVTPANASSPAWSPRLPL